MTALPSLARRPVTMISTGAAAYWLIVLACLHGAPPHPLDDIWEDGIVARHLIAGEGFRSTMIYPPLWSLRDPLTLIVPVLAHGPLLPVALVTPLRILGPSLLDHLAWVSALLAVFAAIEILRVGRRWLGDTRAAGVAAGLFTFSPLMLDAVQRSEERRVGKG